MPRPRRTGRTRQPADIVTRKVLAALFTCDPRTLDNLVVEGMPKEAHGRYSLAKCVPWYLQREREAARASRGLNDLDLARQRKTVAEAQMAEIELAEAEGRVIPLEVHQATYAEACERLRAVLMAIPSKYLHRIQVARTDTEAQAVGEAIRDETLRSLVAQADAMDDDATRYDQLDAEPAA